MKNSTFRTSVVDTPSAAIVERLAAARSAIEMSITAAARAERQVNLHAQMQDESEPDSLADQSRAWLSPSSAHDRHI